MAVIRQLAPLVSIVVPVYNAESFLADTIKSVQAQTYGNWELLLVDDKSTDNSITVIESFRVQDDRIKVTRNKVNTGVAGARNIGVAKAKGRYVAFLDADDVWLPQKLQQQIAFMRENGHAFTFTGYEFANESAQPSGNIVRVPEKMSKDDYLKNNLIWTSTVVIDIKLVDKRIFKMPNRDYGEDALAWCAILSNIQFAYGLNTVMAYYRRTASSLSAGKHKVVLSKLNLYWSMQDLTPVKRILFYGCSLAMAARKRV